MLFLSLSLFRFLSLCIGVQAGSLLLCLFKQKEPGQVEWQRLSHVVDRGVVII